MAAKGSSWYLPGCVRHHKEGERCDCRDKEDRGIWRCRCGTYNSFDDPDPQYCGNEACREPYRWALEQPAESRVPTPREVYLEGRVAELEHRLAAANAQVREALSALLGPRRHGERRAEL